MTPLHEDYDCLCLQVYYTERKCKLVLFVCLHELVHQCCDRIMSAFSFNQSYDTFLALNEHSLEPTIELDLSLYYIIGKKLVWNTISNMISLLFINHGAGECS